jgi:pimeloyl-ACP methyl ester carboxylesterase
MAAVGEAIGALDGVDGHRVAVVGTSFGGYLALRHASALPRVRAIVDIAGPHDLRAFDELQGITREGFREFVGATDEDAARDLLADVTLEGALDGPGPPVLVVHGERDAIIDVRHAHRIAAALGERATVRLEADGNHSCNNLATVVRPAVADWVTDRLGRTDD